jgi:hypothetical protein
VDAARVELLRELLAGSGWVERTRSFGRAVRGSASRSGGLLLVGTEQEEPWHLAAHLTDEAQWSGAEELRPTLVRWQVPEGAPPHLSVTMQRLEEVRRGESVFVVAPDDPGEQLLERVADARRIGATVLSLDSGDGDLQELAHESLSVVRADLVVPELSFDTVQHFVSTATGEAAKVAPRAGFRDRLGRLLDGISGARPPQQY